MATYFLLITLTPEGRAASFEDPSRLLRIERETEGRGVECLGLYGLLGRYDFISMVEADDNDAVAQFSLEYGVRAGAHIETMPAVPISRFEHHEREGIDTGDAEVVLNLPGVSGLDDPDGAPA